MSEQVTQAVLEEATDLIEQTLDTIEALPKYKNDPIVLAGIAIIGLTTGAYFGYLLAKRQLEPKYAAIADEEIAQAKVMYARLNKEGFESPTVAVEKLIPNDEPEAQAALKRYQGQDVHVTVVEDGVLVSRKRENELKDRIADKPAPKTSNIFDQPVETPKEDGWDYQQELARRTDEKPYVVTQEEYFENAPNLEQVSVTYFEGDQVLADEADGVISDIDGTVGETNLHRFGHGSDEEHIVYVFNKKAGMAFEVARSTGKYSVEVIGMDEDDEDDVETVERIPKRRQRLGDD